MKAGLIFILTDFTLNAQSDVLTFPIGASLDSVKTALGDAVNNQNKNPCRAARDTLKTAFSGYGLTGDATLAFYQKRLQSIHIEFDLNSIPTAEYSMNYRIIRDSLRSILGKPPVNKQRNSISGNRKTGEKVFTFNMETLWLKGPLLYRMRLITKAGRHFFTYEIREN